MVCFCCCGGRCCELCVGVCFVLGAWVCILFWGFVCVVCVMCCFLHFVFLVCVCVGGVGFLVGVGRVGVDCFVFIVFGCLMLGTSCICVGVVFSGGFVWGFGFCGGLHECSYYALYFVCVFVWRWAPGWAWGLGCVLFLF